MHLRESFEFNDEHVYVRLNPSDLALESIREICERHDIDSGRVVSGIGTFRNLNTHCVPTDEYPPKKSERNKFLELNGAWEVRTIDGAIANGEPHLHLVAYNGDETIAGHLEEAPDVHITIEITIRNTDGPELERRLNEKNTSILRRRE